MPKRKIKIGDTVYLKSLKKHKHEILNWTKKDGLKKGVKLTVTDLQGIDDEYPWIKVYPSKKGCLHNPEKFSFNKPKNK